MREKKQGPCKGRPVRGSVLMVVLWAGFGLLAVTLVYGHQQAWAYRRAGGLRASARSRAALEGAVRYVETGFLGQEAGGWHDFLTEDMPVGECRFWLIGRAAGAPWSDRPAFGLVDEAAKLNLNTATASMLAGLPGMTPEQAEAIVAWRTPGEERPPGPADGGETPFKGAPFETVEELLRVPGMDADLLYGSDRLRNGVPDLPAANATEFTRGLADYVTVYSREPNVRTDGSPRVHVNAPRRMLREALASVLEEARARELADRLQAGIELPRSVLEIMVRTGMTEEEFAAVADLLTVSEDPYLYGLVNVNTAPAAVLSCIPGIDDEAAEGLVVLRESLDLPNHVGWVLGVLDEEAARAAGPYLTARSRQVSVDAVAVAKGGRGYRRTLWILDFCGPQPERIYRRDLESLGWALGSALAEALEQEDGIAW